jgi:hypothetical protein
LKDILTIYGFYPIAVTDSDSTEDGLLGLVDKIISKTALFSSIIIVLAQKFR